MTKSIFSGVATLLATAVLFVLAGALTGCGGPGIQDQETGRLSLRISINEGSRLLTPEISMEPASYTVALEGPNGESLEEQTAGETMDFPDLAPGSWEVEVSALNDEATVIGFGNGTVTVITRRTATVSITVLPVSGSGTLDLAVNWGQFQPAAPSVTAELTPATGSARSIPMTVNGSGASGSEAGVPTGYHTLAVKLFERGSLAMGTVEVVRIVNGQTTRGEFDFDPINHPGGTVIVETAVDLEKPLEVAISGARPEVIRGEVMWVFARVENSGEYPVYLWYLNGEYVGDGESYGTPADLPAGGYRIDCTAYSTDGSRAGSTGIEFSVAELFTVTAQDRSVSAAGGTPDETAAADFGYFDAAATSTHTNSSGTYTATAGQISALEPDRITMTGSAGESGPFFALEDHSQNAASRFRIRFLLNRRSAIALNGELSILLDDGGSNIGRYGATVSLSGETVIFTAATNQSTSYDDSVTIDNRTFVLNPGLYTLSVEATASCDYIGDPDGYEVGGGGSADVSLELRAYLRE